MPLDEDTARLPGHCDCGRKLRSRAGTGLCHVCGRRPTAAELVHWYAALGVAPAADASARLIRASRVPIYQARAAQRLPLFDPPLPD